MPSGKDPQSGRLKVPVGYQSYMDFLSAIKLRAIVWSFENASRILAMSELLRVSAG